jgi:segregation and condensation protein A
MITDQYLEYLDIMRSLNINVAGDFLIMASTLIHIKSKMLLPQREDEGEEEDPRMEITRPLLEYMRLKAVAEELSDRELLHRDVFSRHALPFSDSDMAGEGPFLEVNLFQLIDAFKRIVDQRLPGVQLRLQLDKWSVKEKTEIILKNLKEKGSIFFNELFGDDRTISEFIVTFLALLELVHLGLVKLFQPALDSDIRLMPAFDTKGDVTIE